MSVILIRQNIMGWNGLGAFIGVGLHPLDVVHSFPPYTLYIFKYTLYIFLIYTLQVPSNTSYIFNMRYSVFDLHTTTSSIYIIHLQYPVFHLNRANPSIYIINLQYPISSIKSPLYYANTCIFYIQRHVYCCDSWKASSYFLGDQNHCKAIHEYRNAEIQWDNACLALAFVVSKVMWVHLSK